MFVLNGHKPPQTISMSLVLRLFNDALSALQTLRRRSHGRFVNVKLLLTLFAVCFYLLASISSAHLLLALRLTH